jgi:hypothetical protein
MHFLCKFKKRHSHFFLFFEKVVTRNDKITLLLGESEGAIDPPIGGEESNNKEILFCVKRVNKNQN